MVLTSFLLMLFMSVGLKAQTTEFSPEVGVSLSTYEAGEMADLTFPISQDSGEVDMASKFKINRIGGTFIFRRFSYK